MRLLTLFFSILASLAAVGAVWLSWKVFRQNQELLSLAQEARRLDEFIFPIFNVDYFESDDITISVRHSGAYCPQCVSLWGWNGFLWINFGMLSRESPVMTGKLSQLGACDPLHPNEPALLGVVARNLKGEWFDVTRATKGVNELLGEDPTGRLNNLLQAKSGPDYELRISFSAPGRLDYQLIHTAE
ncbi:MAG: hypothetical protein M0Z96_03450 [Actinomycetota bacterium]|nr:hypothetical protein [Actinomycetota bacterium]